MIKVYAGIASVGFLLISGAFGCSSASTPDEGDGGTGSTGSTSSTSGTTSNVSGSSSSTGGTSAGTSSTAGTSSSTAGTSSSTAGTGSGGTGTTSAECKGTKNGMACTAEGVDCPNLPCGIADSGVRSCKCQTTWACASCDFTDSPFKVKPEGITTCTTEADKLECTTEGAACEGAPGGQVCVCFRDDEGMLIWDCDAAPPTWAAAAAM